MGIDAVALLRPKKKAMLRKHANHLTPLEDGSVLFLTLMRYRDFEADPASKEDERREEVINVMASMVNLGAGRLLSA
jgi:hypothetical protein